MNKQLSIFQGVMALTIKMASIFLDGCFGSLFVFVFGGTESIYYNNCILFNE